MLNTIATTLILSPSSAFAMKAISDFSTVQPKGAPPDIEGIRKLLDASDLELDDQVQVFMATTFQFLECKFPAATHITQ